MEDGIDHLTERLDGMQRLLIGILISTTTATVFLAINIVVQTAGK